VVVVHPSADVTPDGTGVPASHVPDPLQVATVWHLFPLSQLVPAAATGLEQPVDGEQVPAMWHASMAVH
jgi:hypothetical protein